MLWTQNSFIDKIYFHPVTRITQSMKKAWIQRCVFVL